MTGRWGVQFGPAEHAAVAKVHARGLRTLRYDGAPTGVPKGLRCPCELTRAPCPGQRRPFGATRERFCPPGRRALTGRDHLDAWYRGGALVAVVHYPYPAAWDDIVLREARAGGAELGLCVDVDAAYAIHNPPHTLAVILSRDGLHAVLDGHAQLAP